MNNKKKAQQEILGFVLIVLIVTIIGFVFLMFIFKPDNSEKNSLEISNLLESTMYSTTSCAINYVPQYRDMQELIKECDQNENQKCLNNKEVCEVLDYELKKILDDSLNPEEGSLFKAYKLVGYYSYKNEEGEEVHDKEIITIENGKFLNCSSKPGAIHRIMTNNYGSGIINIELEACKSSN